MIRAVDTGVTSRRDTRVHARWHRDAFVSAEGSVQVGGMPVDVESLEAGEPSDYRLAVG